MITKIRPKFNEPSLKTYATEANLDKAIGKVLAEGDSYIAAYDKDLDRWAVVVICRNADFLRYAGNGFTVTNG